MTSNAGGLTAALSVDGHRAAPADAEGFSQLEASDVQGIEKALVSLRKQYGSAEAAKEGHAGTRNSVANLVVYAASDEDAELVTETMAQLAGAHPARTILLIASLEPDEPGVSASVSAACSLRERQRICYEEIRLHARGRSSPHLRSIIEPLLIADLPVFLWWSGDPPFSDDVFLTLARISNHVVIDSGQFRSPAATLARLGRLIADESVSATVGDLNWPRLASWRELLAQLFDAPAMTALLPDVTRLRISRAIPEKGAHANPAQSLLLAGWLATRLDWEVSRKAERTFAGTFRIPMRGNGHDIMVELRTEIRHEALPGDVQSVQLQSDGGEQAATFTLRRADDQEHAQTSTVIKGTPAQKRSVNFRTSSDAELLDDEIETLDRDPIFEEAVQMAGRIAALLPEGT